MFGKNWAPAFIDVLPKNIPPAKLSATTRTGRKAVSGVHGSIKYQTTTSVLVKDGCHLNNFTRYRSASDRRRKHHGHY